MQADGSGEAGGGDEARPRWFVASLERGLRVISAFGADSPAMTVSEVAERTGMSRAAARRFLLTLEVLDYVAADEQQRYALRAKTLTLGYAFLSSLSLEQLVLPVLRALTKRTTETTNFAMLDAGDVVYVARSIAYRPLHMAIHTGDRLPAYATSLGRVMLAGQTPEALDAYLARTELRPLTLHTCTDPEMLREIIAQVGREGFALVADEIAVGIVSIAVPVRDAEGRVVAAINISSQSGRWSGDEMVERFLEPILEAARALTPAMSPALLRALPDS
ncbi:MAG: IclR family transcriptional regulator C-terminal domain-containing protein [Xanthobacteraceae bacterium]